MLIIKIRRVLNVYLNLIWWLLWLILCLKTVNTVSQKMTNCTVKIKRLLKTDVITVRKMFIWTVKTMFHERICVYNSSRQEYQKFHSMTPVQRKLCSMITSCNASGAIKLHYNFNLNFPFLHLMQVQFYHIYINKITKT